MSQNEFSNMFSKSKSLIQDEYYFKYIFKKTEKIVCAVFYILQSIKDNKGNGELIEEIKNHCLDTLAFVSDSLSASSDQADEAAEVLSLELVGLESRLRVLHAAGLLHADHLNVFAAEIDSALRSAKSYGWTTVVSRREVEEPARKNVQRTVIVPKMPAAERTHEDRRSRILSVLKAQPGASIKDIVDTIKDCSEKTIQRELTSLIKDGLVRREGERRWSKYSVL